MRKRLFTWLARASETKWKSALLGAVVTALCGVGITVLATEVFQNYGGVLFLGLPSFCGFVSVFIYSLREERSPGSAYGVALLSMLLVGLMLCAFAIEGLICLVLAAPLALLAAAPGVCLGRAVAESYRSKHNPVLPVIGAVLLLPLLLGFESKLDLQPPTRKVVTAVDINSDAATVWNYVVAFPPIPEPTELIFRTGIAYPKDAKIVGTGVGAMRYCNFSTGPFVEPIRVWDKPRLLKFDVIRNPSPMREISFYPDLQPNHLHGFMVSEAGQFKLTQVNATTIRLEGTTWYHHKLWPTGYWGVISDGLIHTIHRRVLDHIKVQAEGKLAGGEANHRNIPPNGMVQ